MTKHGWICISSLYQSNRRVLLPRSPIAIGHKGIKVARSFLPHLARVYNACLLNMQAALVTNERQCELRLHEVSLRFLFVFYL